MKMIRPFRQLLLVALFALVAVGTTQASPYRHDKSGYWDAHNRHHAYVYRHHHHGYWDDRGGSRVFINID